MIRVVLDTNVLISSLLKADSGPAQIVALWRAGELELVMSPDTLKEIAQVLSYEKIRSRVTEKEAERFVHLLGSAVIVNPSQEIRIVQDDPDDDKFIALAIESGAEFLVSGDKHILTIGALQEIQIVTPAAFLHGIGYG